MDNRTHTDDTRRLGRVYSTPIQTSPQPASLNDEAYEILRTSIIEGTLKPGHRVYEKDLAAQMGMSKTPVHQAIVRLKDEGFLEIHPRRGIEVLRQSDAEVLATYEILAALEGAALLQLANKRPPKLLNDLDDATRQMEDALLSGNLRAWAEADDRFHCLIIQSCENPRLVKLAMNFYDLAHWARMVTLFSRAHPGTSSAEHGEIVDALRAGEGQLARQLMDAHRQKASRIVARELGAI